MSKGRRDGRSSTLACRSSSCGSSAALAGSGPVRRTPRSGRRRTSAPPWRISNSESARSGQPGCPASVRSPRRACRPRGRGPERLGSRAAPSRVLRPGSGGECAARACRADPTTASAARGRPRTRRTGRLVHGAEEELSVRGRDHRVYDEQDGQPGGEGQGVEVQHCPGGAQATPDRACRCLRPGSAAVPRWRSAVTDRLIGSGARKRLRRCGRPGGRHEPARAAATLPLVTSPSPCIAGRQGRRPRSLYMGVADDQR